MAAEKEWIKTRFRSIKGRQDSQERKMSRGIRMQLQREYRLLGKILSEVPEGRVLRTLAQWRNQFGRQLDDYERNDLPERKRWYREWQQLPPSEKMYYPEPADPDPKLKIRDRSGYIWIIDHSFLKMIDELIKSLKWHMEARGLGYECHRFGSYLRSGTIRPLCENGSLASDKVVKSGVI